MFSLYVFCKLPIPDRVKHILDTMELEDETELVYIDKIGTPDEYKSIASSAPNVGTFMIYDGTKTKNGKDCLIWYTMNEDRGLLTHAESAWYFLREFTLGFSGIGELLQYVDEEGIFIVTESP
ncbi:hypothetical protein BGZ88_010163 [Linnemannia elongata]|nr:hypothetical protein BGZ88_010163 [Linnemannia elongata]